MKRMLPFTKTLSEPAEFVGVPVVLAKPAATFLPNLPISNKFKHGFVADAICDSQAIVEAIQSNASCSRMNCSVASQLSTVA